MDIGKNLQAKKKPTNNENFFVLTYRKCPPARDPQVVASVSFFRSWACFFFPFLSFFSDLI